MKTPTIAITLLLLAAPALALQLPSVEDLDVEIQSAGPNFASPEDATIRPGVQMFTNGAQCTSNFVFTDGVDAYIGYAAHCANDGAATATNGCDNNPAAIGTPVEIDGAQYPGTLAFSSWDTMIANGENVNSDICAYNDFAVVKIDPRDIERTSPSVQHFGGPVALCENPGAYQEVISYGNSGLRFGIDLVAPKTGVVLYMQDSGWSSQVYMATPGIPGDSGSGYMTDDHCAWGVTSTVAIAPYTASNGISSLALGLEYAAANGFDVELVTADPITSFIL